MNNQGANMDQQTRFSVITAHELFKRAQENTSTPSELLDALNTYMAIMPAMTEYLEPYADQVKQELTTEEAKTKFPWMFTPPAGKE